MQIVAYQKTILLNKIHTKQMKITIILRRKKISFFKTKEMGNVQETNELKPTATKDQNLNLLNVIF